MFQLLPTQVLWLQVIAPARNVLAESPVSGVGSSSSRASGCGRWVESRGLCVLAELTPGHANVFRLTAVPEPGGVTQPVPPGRASGPYPAPPCTGVTQIALGSMIVAISFAALAITNSAKIRHSCPFWAGFAVLLAGLIGVISWKRPLSLVVTFFTLLSVVCVMLSLAGSILSCQNAQTVRALDSCQMVRPEIGLEREGLCMCCDLQTQRDRPRLCGALGELLKLHHFQDCTTVRMALKDLLFSVCGLSILSTIICTLSTVLCCIHMFGVNMLHILVPQRPRPLNPECSSPHENFLRNLGELEEFVPPVPPPPYYPPEYTCSSETDAQSITYNGSMDSPVPLYPSDYPPPYETVMRYSTTSQVTDGDHQLTEISNSSFCEHAFSGEGSMDSGSLMMSEIIDIPDDSSCSEDSCLLGVGGQRPEGVRGQRPEGAVIDQCPGAASPCGRSGRSFSCSAPGPSASSDDPHAHSCQRLDMVGTPAQMPARRSDSSPPRAWRRRHSDGSRPPTPVRSLEVSRVARSNSDPGLFVAATGGEARTNWRSKPSEEVMSQTSTDTAPCSEACFLPGSQHGTPELLRRLVGAKVRPTGKDKAPRTLWKDGTRSLGDLKMCRGTRVLVARFLQRSKRNLAAEYGHGSSGPAGGKRRVDRRRIGSSSDQVPRCSGTPAGCHQSMREDSFHLQSCGDISSSASSLRHLVSAGALEGSRPHSLIGVYRETVL
ncbi:protein ENTREP2-like [Narcine bancroftii]|uniref:protein ENTREP2-like n=1 Tax=Narcine bancroftii TaxID=1343680 RepID=UPI003831D0F2